MSMAQYVTYASYIVFVALCLIGGKFKFRKGQYHEDAASVEVMKSLKGIAALGVILHHISQHDTFQRSFTMHAFVNAGYFFVAIFFFCSGYGLFKSFDKKPDYLNGFIKNRIGKGIALPYYVNILIYGLFFFFTGVKMPAMQWVFNCLGLTMMDVYAWFPVVMIIMYFIFYLTFKFIKNRYVIYGVIFASIIFLGAVFSVNGHFAWWNGKENWWLWGFNNVEWWMNQKVLWFNGEWWVNSIIAFLVGLIVADKETSIRKFFAKFYYVKLIVLAAFSYASLFLYNLTATKFGYWTEYSGNGPGIKDKFVTYLSQIPEIILFVLLIYVVLLKFHAINPITKFFGKFSLHTYLMNYLALGIVEEFINKQHFFNKFKYFLPSYAIGVLILTIVLGLGEYYLTEGIAKLIFRKKKVAKAN